MQDALPVSNSRFIALAPDAMNWEDAGAFCSSLGGRLPLINGSATWAWVWDEGGAAVSIDGFGTDGGLWPAGVPADIYWTGTEVRGRPDAAWFVSHSNGRVYIFRARRTYSFRVACVP